MTYPTNPTNGQQATVNGVVYTYNSAKGVWAVTSSFTGNITVNQINTDTVIATGNISTSGTLTATNLVETSSITLKENIRPIENALDSLTKLVSVIYDRRDGSARDEPGLIAEKVNEILPELVVKDSDGNPMGIRYSKITVYLIDAIKSLKDELDYLKGK